MIKYKDIGFKLTPQRMAIMDILEDNTSHPSADEIFARVRETYPTMSFATVYNTLEALTERGRVVELSIDPRKRRYDPNTAPHHHLMCVVCGAISDIYEDFNLVLPEAEQGRFRIIESHVEFYGVCPKCDAKEEGKEVA